MSSAARVLVMPSPASVDADAAALGLENLCNPLDFFRPSVCLTGERRLCLTLIRGALDDLCRPPRSELYCAACAWIRGADASLTFDACCTALRFEAAAVRGRLVPLLRQCPTPCGPPVCISSHK